MDDPQLQRAIYASIQTARSQGHSLSANKGAGQSFRPSLHQPARGTGGGGGAGVHRSTPAGASHGGNAHHHRNQAQRPQPQLQSRGYAGNSLPGMGPSTAAGASSANSLRTSFGRIDALRRDGIAPASSGPVYPHSHPHAHSNAPFRAQAQAHPPAGPPPPASPSHRALPTSVPPRGTPSPARLRNQTQQQLQTRQRQSRGPGHHGLQAAARLRIANPVLEAIAAATSEEHSAVDGPTAYGTAGGAAVSPINVTPLSPSGVRSPPAAQSQRSQTAATAVGVAGAAAAAAPVGGGGPPPRALVPVATPGGSVVMLPEGVDPALAQAVLRDAVTWDTGVTFDDIAGCDRAKQLLHEAVALPLIIPEFFTGIREPWRGVLLHGPPGNGKTMLAKAVAGMVGGAFFAVSPASLTSKWRGESEKLLAALFAVAQAHAPAIIFIDEVDALGGARGAEGEHEASRRFKAELLQQMDGLSSGRGVMVLAATNCPWDLDPALRRRLEKRIHIGLPDASQRLALLQLHLRGVALAADVDLPALAATCEGFSGADIRLLCRDAAMAPLRRQLGSLAMPASAGNSALQQQQHHHHHHQQHRPASASARPSDQPQPDQPQSQSQFQPQPQSTAQLPQPPQPQPTQPLVLRSAADIRRLADSGELARGAVVGAADLEAARGSLRPSVAAEQAARYSQWDQEFAST